MYTLKFEPQAEQDIIFFNRSGNTPLNRKIATLLTELAEHPCNGTGKPEMLRGGRTGQWSRRINQEHRLIYIIEDDINAVTVISARGHYE